MEGDKTADNEKELTSTSSSSVMDKLLSTNKEEKNDSNDTLPTSSTDASTSIKSTHLVSDDPISSTSSEMDSSKPKAVDNLSTDDLGKASSNFDTDAELLGMSIVAQPSEKIEENVDDLVNDLETLLGESTDSFTLSSKSTETNEEKTEVTSAIQEDLINLLEDKPEDEVSSNTDTNTFKIAATVETTETVVHDIAEGEIEDTLSNKSKDSEIVTDLAQKETQNENSENISDSPESIGDSKEVQQAENIPSEICENEENQRKESTSQNCPENADPEQIVEHIENKEDSDKNRGNSDDMKNDIVQQMPKVVETEIHDVEKEGSNKSIEDLPPSNIESGMIEQKESGDLDLEKDVIIDNKQNEGDQLENLQADTINEKQGLSRENVDEGKETKDHAGCSQDAELSEVDRVSPVQGSVDAQEKKCEVEIETNGSEDTENSEEICKQVEEYIEEDNELVKESAKVHENMDGFVPDDDKVEGMEVIDETSIDDKCKTVNIITLEPKDSLVSNLVQASEENLDKAGTSMEVEKNDPEQPVNLADDSGLKEEVQHHVMEVVEYSDQLNKEDRLANNGSVVELHDTNIPMDASDVEETVKPIQENIGIDHSSSDIEGEEASIEAGMEAVDSKESAVDSVQGQQTSEEIVSGEQLEQIQEHSEKLKDDSCIKDIDSDDLKQAQSIMDTMAIEKEDVKVDLNKEDSSEDINLPEEKEVQAEDTENFKQVEGSSEGSEETKTFQGEKPKNSFQEPQEVEITELPDVKVPEDAQTIQVDPVIQEPEEDAQSIEQVNQPEDDNIEEISEEEDAKEHLEVIKDVPVIVNVDQNQGDNIVVTKADMVDEDVIQQSGLAKEDVEMDKCEAVAVEDEVHLKKLIGDRKLSSEIATNKNLNSLLGDVSRDEVSETKDLETCGSEVLMQIEKDVQPDEKGTATDKESENVKDLEESSEGVLLPQANKVVEFTRQEGADEKRIDIADGNVDVSEPKHLELSNELETVDTIDGIADEGKSDTISEKDCHNNKEKVEVTSITSECEPLEDNKQSENMDVVEESEAANDNTENIVAASEKSESNTLDVIKEFKNDDVVEEKSVSQGSDNAVPEVSSDNNGNNENVDMTYKVSKPQGVGIESANLKTVENDVEDEKSIAQESVDPVSELDDIIDHKSSESELLKASNESEKVVNTIEDIAEAEKLISPISEDPEPVASDNKDNLEVIQGTPKTVLLADQEENKPIPEINIRRKTVEQDLEKVVCLSEESSDSDINEPANSLSKPIQVIPPYDEETNLIKIAEEVEQFSDPEIPCEESMPGIEDILSGAPEDIPSVAPVDSASNLETILAVASLQNETVLDVKVERRLSEKEIREMEAIRMAVASITDSSQDTYDDGFLIDNSIAMDTSIQELSNDAQELPNELPDDSKEAEVLPEGIVGSSCEDNQDMLIEKSTLVENDKTEDNVNKLVHEEVSNSDQNEASIIDDSSVKDILPHESDEKVTSVGDNIKIIESIPSTESSEVVDSIESQNNDEVTESECVNSSKGLSEDTQIPSEHEGSQENVIQIAESGVSNKDIQIAEQKLIESEKVTEATKGNEVAFADQTVKENAVSIPEDVAKENIVPTPEDTFNENVSSVTCNENVTSLTEEIVKEKEVSISNVSKENDVSASEEGSFNDKLSAPVSDVEGNEVIVLEKPLKDNLISLPEVVVEGNKVETSADQVIEERPLRTRTRRGNKANEPLSISVEEVERKEKVYSPKVTIKPVKVPDEEVSTTSDAEGNKGSLKMTITKQSDKMHSILKVYNPEDEIEPCPNEEEPIPKLIIKPKMQQIEQQHSPKMTTRSSKVYSPTSTRCSSPRITIKPVTKPTETKIEALSPLKITFKPVVKPEEGTKRNSPKTAKELDQKNHNPKITIKPIPRPPEVEKEETLSSTPKVTIRPLKRHIDEIDAENEPERSSPKITIKPVVKPIEQDSDQLSSQAAPKLKIKPIKKLDDEEQGGLEKDQGSPKISIKPLIKPAELEDEEAEVKERIVLKINKGNLPTPSKDSKKREYPEDDKSEKVGIKLKFSTTGGHTHIVQGGEESNKRQRKDSGYSGNAAKKDIEEASHKRPLEEKLPEKNKKLRTAVTPDKLNEDSNDDLKIVESKIASPITISEDSRSQNSADCVVLDDSLPVCPDISKIVDIASRTTHIEASPIITVGVATPTLTPAPKKRGRPRKVPLEVREELKDPPTTPQSTPHITPQNTPGAEALSTPESAGETPEATPSPGGRPKRSCRGQNVMATLGIKPRKPRGRGRGSKVNMGDREPPVLQAPTEPVQTVAMKPEKEAKVSKAKLKLMQKAAEEEAQKQKEVESDKAAHVIQSGPAEQREEANNQKEIQVNKEKEEISQKEKTIEEKPSLQEEKFPLEEQEDKRKGLEDASKKEVTTQKQVEGADETEILKRKRDELDEETPHKKKKEDKTPPRKLEVTTRRQKAQLQKEADDADKTPTETAKVEAKSLTKVLVSTNPEPSTSVAHDGSSTGVPKESPIPPSEHIDPLPSTSAEAIVEEVVVISTDDDSCGKEDSSNKLEEVKDPSREYQVKNSPESKVNSPPKRTAEKSGDSFIEEKRARVEEQKAKAEEEVAQIDVGERKLEEDPKVEEEETVEDNKKEDEKKVDGASAEEDVDSGEDSEAERRREWVLLKKQEAIKKCRAKRMEKLARAAELKKKRQEQAAQQREARKAAEEAEKAAAEKSRATKRYGRYGVPKPQISLIDEPVQETAGTIKSHMGLFDPETERVNITQPVLIDDDSNFDKERTGPLKHIESHLTPVKSSPQKLLGPEPMVVDSADDTPTKARRSIGTEDVVMLDEETRMSADFRGSRAQTPAKQAIPPPDIMVEDSQGSIGTEGGKSRSSKAPKMEVFQDAETTVFTAEQLAEYSWNGQGPFMLQEQVAQYLGIKSFKRKYPNITRRPVDMQERDYLKEHCLATEAQCDLGLTAVIAQDILDIMYTDFQDKYEDYCRSQREKQARELVNKQKALSQFALKPGFDKLDILEQAVQSAAAWNQQLNKARREQRKAHMDLQNLTVHYPKSKMKVIPTPKIGHYPVALVPGQFTDHYKEYTPTELNNLPLNTMCYDEIKIPGMESESEESSSGSESDSDSSSGSSSSESSCDDEDCKDCSKHVKTEGSAVRETDSDDVVIIENDASSSDSVVLVSVTAAPVTA